MLVGSVSIVPFPSDWEFQTFNRQVAVNNGWHQRNEDRIGRACSAGHIPSGT